jgi:hypothetical protein
MLAGRVPFDGDSAMAVIYQQIHEPPPPIQDLPPQIQAVIDRALAKNPDERYQSANQMAADFYEAIGVHAEAVTIPPTLQSQTPEPATPPKRQTPIWIGAGIFICACVSLILAGVVGLSALNLLPTREVPQANPTITEVINTPAAEETSENIIPNTSASPVGVLRFQNSLATLDQLTINATLDPLPENMQYEVWMIDDGSEQSLSLGGFEQSTGDQFSLTFIEPEGQNLLAITNRMEITLEPSPDDSPNSSRDVQYSGALPPESLEHIRHLLVGFQATPGQIPIAVGLVDNVTLIKDAADAMLVAFNEGDDPGLRSNAENIVNLIVGSENSDFYNDWDEDGSVNDPGDGFGLLINGGQAGYLDSTFNHANFAAEAPGATDEIQLHASHVAICVQNLETWAPALRDLALNIALSSESQDIEADLREAVTLANQMLDGIDMDGSESIDPTPGEGGAITAFIHAGYMSDIPIFPGEDQGSSH